MKIVITGSMGFIGKELKQHCRANNIEFIGIDIVPCEDTNHIIMDIRSSEIEKVIPENVDALIHLSAISRDQDCREDPITAFDVNVGGTLNLIHAAQRRGVKQFVFASSEWVYGDVGNADIQTEESVIDAARITSEYALTKIVGERVLHMAHQRGFCPVTVLRFGIVYGPRSSNWSAVESLFHTVATQDQVTVGSLATARRFVHIADIAAGITSTLGRTGFEVFNLSGDRLITLRDVIEQSSELLGRQPTVCERDAASVSIRNPDNRKACELLKWTPALGLKDGLATLMTNCYGR